MSVEADIDLSSEVTAFDTTADRIALGDLEIRKTFARDVMMMFAIANLFVLFGLGVVFWQDCTQLAAG